MLPQDTSGAVRKRVIRIFKEICLKSPDNPKRHKITLLLFSRMKETNESILKLVSATFEELWFSNSDTLQNRVVTKGEHGGEKKFSRPFRDLVQQIIDSIAGCGDDEEVGRYLVDLVVKMLGKEERKTAKAQTKSDREKVRVFGICEDMVSVVVDKLMRYDFRTQSEKRWDHIKPLVNALYVFSRVRPTFCSKHFVTLQSFIIPLPKLPKSMAVDGGGDNAGTALTDSVRFIYFMHLALRILDPHDFVRFQSLRCIISKSALSELNDFFLSLISHEISLSNFALSHCTFRKLICSVLD